MSAVSAFLAPPSAVKIKLTARVHRTYRRCAVTPMAGRPSSFPDAKGFSEEDKNGATVGDVMQMPEKKEKEWGPPPEMKVPEGGAPEPQGQGEEVMDMDLRIRSNQGSKWQTFYAEDGKPYYFNMLTEEVQWCVRPPYPTHPLPSALPNPIHQTLSKVPKSSNIPTHRSFLSPPPAPMYHLPSTCLHTQGGTQAVVDWWNVAG